MKEKDKETGVSMITVSGTCPFCKQMVALQVNEDTEHTDRDLEELAKMTCTCDAAQDYQNVETNIRIAQDRMMKRFEAILKNEAGRKASPAAAAAVDFIFQAIRPVAEGRVIKMAIQATSELSYSVYQGKNGTVVVEQKEVFVEKE